MTSDTLNKLALYSLAILWVFTGLTSVLFAPEIGYQVLARAKITGVVADICVYSGAMLDIVLGLWLLTDYRIKLCCQAQIAVITSYSILLTIIDASFWLHPFGPLTKNLPILVLLLMLRQNSSSRK